MPSPTPFRAVLFDFGQVLSGPPEPTAWLRLQQLLHASETDFAAAYWAHRHSYDRGDLTAKTYWKTVAEDLHQQLTPSLEADLIAADTALWAQPNQPMIDFALGLAGHGLRTGILSNIGDAMEAGILAHFDWLGRFDHHTFSHRLRIAKPELAIYAHASEGLRTRSEQILFIDDREENVVAARQVGMTAIHYTSHPQFLSALRELHLGHLIPAITDHSSSQNGAGSDPLEPVLNLGH